VSRKLTDAEKTQIYDEIRQFLAEELEMDIEKITPDARVINDLGGDSLMYLELVDQFKNKYDVMVEMRVIGQYFQSHPVHTVQQIAQAVYDIVEGGEALIGKAP
jgi:acyl carrier protein